MDVFIDIVIVGVGDKCDICFVVFGGYCLVGFFFIECYLIMVVGDGFVWCWESVKVKNVIGIDIVKDDKFVCSFYYFCFWESVLLGFGGVCFVFFFLYCFLDCCQFELYIIV